MLMTVRLLFGSVSTVSVVMVSAEASVAVTVFVTVVSGCIMMV